MCMFLFITDINSTYKSFQLYPRKTAEKQAAADTHKTSTSTNLGYLIYSYLSKLDYFLRQDIITTKYMHGKRIVCLSIKL